MKLIGSTTSPYVRRIRLLLGDDDYEFVNLDIYGKDRDELRRSNPALKIPMIQDGDQDVYDSRVISRYIASKRGDAPLDWDQENQLTLIDAVNDSCVTLVLSKKSGIDVDQDITFYNLQRERIMMSLRTLAAMVDGGEFAEWDYPSICLYSLVDWLQFRDVVDFPGVESLVQFRDSNKDRPKVAETDPRQ
ncbi:glutathione S-transferase family protein [Marinobacter nanhaiticus D15-8W]|uniref:Glutathione S-transferase family protein n=1 Tax=Marinobacter nanhaiticus D15-8W TaxID=626887 RepID=N6WX09_9GAMM|nr:glutathione S-transferase N-terminal domain-containing protein [Marinobacter nanhaiticus]ENO15607.2 glutathione S-transferase family protein [Marinobacter nanhaiticus D15-8W]